MIVLFEEKKPHLCLPGSYLRHLYLRFLLILFLGFLVLFRVSPTHAQDPAHEPLSEVAFEQKLNEQVPLDLMFQDETGKSAQLGDYFGQKPVILTLNYYNCPMLCPLVLEELASSLAEIPFTMGDQFNVVTVSIDPRETPKVAAATKEKYTRRYGRPGAEAGWHFLTGEEAAIQRLAQAVGFRYAYDAESDQYAHPAGVMILTPQGKISRYFYGIEYAPIDLRLGLVEASANKIGSFVDQVLLRCYHYDPITGKYTLIAMNVLRLAGLATVLLTLGTFVFVMFRRDRRENLRLEP